MPRASRRPARPPAPREFINRPLLLILAAGLVVFIAFQYSFKLAAVAAAAVGLIGWLGWRRLTPPPAPRGRARRSRAVRRRT